MVFDIKPTKEFEKDFKKLDSSIQKRVKDKLGEVAENPTHYKYLHYDLKGSCRLWIGKLRIIYSYDPEKNEMYLETSEFHHSMSGGSWNHLFMCGIPSVLKNHHYVAIYSACHMSLTGGF